MTTGLIAVLAALSLPPVSRDTVPLYTDLGTLEVPITTSAPPSRLDGLSIEEWRDRALKAESELAQIEEAARNG